MKRLRLGVPLVLAGLLAAGTLLGPGAPVAGSPPRTVTPDPVPALCAGEGTGPLRVAGERDVEVEACAAPRTRWWFVGGGTTAGQRATLLLANPDPVPAVVDVEVLTEAGPVDARPGRGVVVPAAGRLALELDRLAPDRDLLAVHVVAERGRVTAALRHALSEGTASRGSDLVPDAGPPAEELLVAGLPAGPGRRAVVVANPGPDPLVVQLELVTEQGTVPAQELAVPAGATAGLDLSDAVRGTAAAVQVRSTGGPVLAGALVLDAAFRADGTPVGRTRALSWAGAARPLARSAPVGPSTSLLLFGTDRGGTAVLEPSGRTVQVPAGRAVRVPDLAGVTAVRPRDGAVTGVGVLRESRTRASLVPLRWAPGPRAVPGVRSGTVLRAP